VFTGGIGENGASIRAEVCANLQGLGIVLDPAKNAATRTEGCISAPESISQVWVVPTNEELIVARQTRDLLSTSGFPA
jgi:acetate kinase